MTISRSLGRFILVAAADGRPAAEPLRDTPAVRRYRLAKLRPEGRMSAGPGADRLAHIRRAYD